MSLSQTTPVQKTALRRLGFSEQEISAMDLQAAEERIAFLGHLLEDMATPEAPAAASSHAQPSPWTSHVATGTPGPSIPVKPTDGQGKDKQPHKERGKSANKPIHEIMAQIVFSILFGFFVGIVLMETGYNFLPTFAATTGLMLTAFFLYWRNKRARPPIDTKEKGTPLDSAMKNVFGLTPSPSSTKKSVLIRYTSGRLGQKAYGKSVLGICFVLMATMATIGVLGGVGLLDLRADASTPKGAFSLAVIIVSTVTTIAMLYLFSAVSVQRVNDIGLSGWWICVPVILCMAFPLLFLVLGLALFALPGTKKDNAYGTANTDVPTQKSPSEKGRHLARNTSQKSGTPPRPMVFTMTYTTGDGHTSTRRITPLLHSEQYLQAFCLERDDHRTFRKDRIANVVDPEGNRLTADAFWKSITEDPNVGDLDKACAAFLDDILEPSLIALAHLARADGAIGDEQMDTIDMFIDETVEQSNLYIEERAKENLKRLTTATKHTQEAFDNALEKIRDMATHYQSTLCETAYTVAEEGAHDGTAEKRFKAIVEACNNPGYLAPWH